MTEIPCAKLNKKQSIQKTVFSAFEYFLIEIRNILTTGTKVGCLLTISIQKEITKNILSTGTIEGG